jgi:hypothetical protein
MNLSKRPGQDARTVFAVSKDVFLKRGLRDGIFSSSGIAGN